MRRRFDLQRAASKGSAKPRWSEIIDGLLYVLSLPRLWWL